MGAWGVGPFENDTASDFVLDLLDADGGLAELRSTLGHASASAPEELEAPLCEASIAAAALVALGRGALVGQASDRASEWGQRYGHELAVDDVELAIAAARMVVACSGLRELWDESPSAAEWHAAIGRLLGSLEGLRKR